MDIEHYDLLKHFIKTICIIDITISSLQNDQALYFSTLQVPGVAFRGRLFVEIFTKPSYSVGVFNELTESPADSKSKVEVTS